MINSAVAVRYWKFDKLQAAAIHSIPFGWFWAIADLIIFMTSSSCFTAHIYGFSSKSVVLQQGSAKQFSEIAKYIPKNQNDAPKEKKFVFSRFSGNISFQTKLKHNLL